MTSFSQSNRAVMFYRRVFLYIVVCLSRLFFHSSHPHKLWGAIESMVRGFHFEWLCEQLSHAWSRVQQKFGFDSHD
ncbi:hypothetical protein BDV26DRAFT_271578 [Aspergillus bertholletiae]|uniref:Uncharacterized protein n=1 Tax=Aspergillus bertholletiae TaxID=1226010 RepID=A0A5N7AVC8_9EURO|nr:hypothetical protein BDV26DRAFT_271578 [Aspergillus bertholletiae]